MEELQSVFSLQVAVGLGATTYKIAKCCWHSWLSHLILLLDSFQGWKLMQFCSVEIEPRVLYHPALLAQRQTFWEDLSEAQCKSYGNISWICLRKIKWESLINNRMGRSRIDRGPFEVGSKKWDRSIFFNITNPPALVGSTSRLAKPGEPYTDPCGSWDRSIGSIQGPWHAGFHPDFLVFRLNGLFSRVHIKSNF